jgi:2-amino-4-hydroxy-6-hydroxymethyldihydropteridine diphosphokinase
MLLRRRIGNMPASPVSLVHVGLGANLGDRAATLRRAVDELAALGEVVARSSLWETAPVGGGGGGDYLNAAVALATPLAPEPLLEALRAIERRHGRDRSGGPNAPRTLDLDVLLWGDRILRTPSLEVPHPRMHARRFVLAPLAEIAARAIHPVLQCSIVELLARLPATPAARRLDEPL